MSYRYRGSQFQQPGIIYTEKDEMSDEAKQLASRWSMEPHESLNPNSGTYRIIADSDRERWKQYHTSARVPYMAMVYSHAVAVAIVEEHNRNLKSENGKLKGE